MEKFDSSSNAKLAFRDALRPADVDAITRVVSSTGFFSENEIEVARKMARESLNLGRRAEYRFLLAELDEELVGYSCFSSIGLTLASWDLLWIAVHGRHRAKGVGKILLRKSEEVLGTLGARRIYIETSGRAQYEPTRQFYLSNGYRQEAVLGDFYQPGDDKIIFVKALDLVQ